MLKNLLHIALALFLLAPHFSLGQQGGNTIRLLTDEWQVYDEDEKLYVPYMPNYHSSPSQLHLLLSTASLEAFYITIKAKGATHLFTNNQLLYVFDSMATNNKEIEITISIADLLKTQKDSTNQLMLSLYAANEQELDVISTSISKYNAQANIADVSHAYWERKEKPKSIYQSTLSLLGIGLLVVFAIFYRITTPIFNMNYLSRYLSGFTKTKSEGGKINSTSFVLFGVFYALVLAYLLTLIQPFDPLNLGNHTFSTEILRSFGELVLWIITFLFIKFTLVWLTGMLYDNRKVFNIHVQEYMNINQIFGIGLLVSAGALHFSNGLVYSTIRENSFIVTCIAMIISGLLVSYRINKTLPFKKVYLFSYLCGTEFFPVLVLIKFLMEQQSHFFST